MADETQTSEGTVPPEPDAAPAPAGERQYGRLGAWVLVTLCAAFVAVQWAGLLLRDRLERRVPALAHAPAAEPGARAETLGGVPAGEAAPLFGPDVREVAVAGPGLEAVAETATAPAGAPPAVVLPAPQPSAPVKAAAPAVEPAVAKPAPVSVARPKAPEPAVKPPVAKPGTVAPALPKAPAAVPAEAATHALLVDVFLSQRYLREAEAKLSSLGIAHLRTEISRRGRGFRVSAAAADEAGRKAARGVLDRGGYAYRATAAGLEVFVYYRDEAQQVADSLAKAGAPAGVAPVDGERPFWRLFAGPFPEAEARRVRKLLETRGVRTSLEIRP